MRRDVFQAIADPTRRAIINMIAHEALSVNAVAEKFDVSRVAISKHLKVLTECGLIEIRQRGRERYCEAKLAKMKEVADFIEPFHKMWDDRFNKLETIMKQYKSKE